MKRFLLLLILVTAISAQARSGLLESLGLDQDVAVPFDVDVAFIFSAQIKDPQTIIASWQIAEGNYLYRDKIRFEILETDHAQLLDFSLPAGENKIDEVFGLSEVYATNTDVLLPINRINYSQAAQQITLKAFYQGCSETFHICYPPTEKTILLTLPALNDAPSLNNSLPEQDRIAQHLSQDSVLKILFSFFGLGLLLAFTPCVFPMIPILSSIIVGQGERITSRRAFILSLSYILAMSLTYTAAGVLTGLLGENIQSMFQNPWIIGSFSALFVIFALSMFGLFEIQLPHAIQHRLHKINHQQQGGNIAGAAVMGLLSALIVGPCLAPPLAGALIFIGQHGNPILGGAALFSLSMGMGLPLLIIGTSAGSLLPKAGAWINSIKAVFGVLMLALAIWMLERIIPASIGLLLWGGLLIISAIYLGALNKLKLGTTSWQKLWQGLGLILLIYGGILIIGGAIGNHNIWQPLHNINSSSTNNREKVAGVAFTKINNLAELKQQLSQTNMPVMLDFYADWCVDCKKMEVTTFQDKALLTALNGIKSLQLDMTENTPDHKALLKHLGVFGPPTLLFFDANGEEYKQYRWVGSITAPVLIDHLFQLPHIQY